MILIKLKKYPKKVKLSASNSAKRDKSFDSENILINVPIDSVALLRDNININEITANEILIFEWIFLVKIMGIRNANPAKKWNKVAIIIIK